MWSEGPPSFTCPNLSGFAIEPRSLVLFDFLDLLLACITPLIIRRWSPIGISGFGRCPDTVKHSGHCALPVNPVTTIFSPILFGTGSAALCLKLVLFIYNVYLQILSGWTFWASRVLRLISALGAHWSLFALLYVPWCLVGDLLPHHFPVLLQLRKGDFGNCELELAGLGFYTGKDWSSSHVRGWGLFSPHWTGIILATLASWRAWDSRWYKPDPWRCRFCMRMVKGTASQCGGCHRYWAHCNDSSYVHQPHRRAQEAGYASGWTSAPWQGEDYGWEGRRPKSPRKRTQSPRQRQNRSQSRARQQRQPSEEPKGKGKGKEPMRHCLLLHSGLRRRLCLPMWTLQHRRPSIHRVRLLYHPSSPSQNPRATRTRRS